MTFENDQKLIVIMNNRKILNKIYSLSAFPIPFDDITNHVQIDSYFDDNAPLIESLIKGYTKMGNLNLKIVNEFKPCEQDTELRINKFNKK